MTEIKKNDVAGKRTIKNVRPATRRNTTSAAALLLAAVAAHASAANLTKSDFGFVNVADTTQGFALFGSMPAINNAGEVAGSPGTPLKVATPM